MHIKTSNQETLNLGFGNYTCNWGLHIAGLYETEEERDEIVFGFFEQGLKDNDLGLFCPAERSLMEFKRAFAHHCPQCNEVIQNNSENFTVKSPKEFYYPNGTFSPWEMDESLKAYFDFSQQKGPRNVRASAEMAWALEAIPGVDDLMAYESRLNYFIPGKPWISICLYNVNKFKGKTIMGVLRTHPFTISGGIITQNPYYQDPDKWLEENAPQFLYK
jgi:hypothetical protein